MQYEKSCGAVIYHQSQFGNVHYLAIQSKQHHEWGLPKGHVEPGESEWETAKREVWEETGLSIQKNHDFRTVVEYSPAPGVRKEVVFFLAEVDSTEVVMQPEEVMGYRWGTYDQIYQILGYDTNKQVLETANRFLKDNQRKTS